MRLTELIGRELRQNLAGVDVYRVSQGALIEGLKI
jgi:hypothetical protein